MECGWDIIIQDLTPMFPILLTASLQDVISAQSTCNATAIVQNQVISVGAIRVGSRAYWGVNNRNALSFRYVAGDRYSSQQGHGAKP